MKIKEQPTEVYNLDEEKFWRKADEILAYGIPARDKQGHTVDIRFKVRPTQKDVIAGVQYSFNEKTWKYQTDLCRTLLALGCHLALEMVRRKHGENVDDIQTVLDILNRTEKHERLYALRKEISEASDKVLFSDDEDRDEIIARLIKFKKRITEKLNGKDKT